MTTMNRGTVFTTSWDDGHPLDARLAELLSKHGFGGTFYMPLSNREGLPVLHPTEMRRLGQRFEIGSHTIDHCYLTSVDTGESRRQIVDGKYQIEQVLGHSVAGFCYPGGQYTLEHRKMVVDAGFEYARTISNFHQTLLGDPFCVPTTIQCYPHKREVLVRNFVKRGEWIKRCGLFFVAVGEENFAMRLRRVLDHVCLHGEMFHLWGHSWELEGFDGWRQLDDFLRYAADRIPVDRRLSNREVLHHAFANGS